MTEQLTIEHEIARRQAERGMHRALERAADGLPEWPELAYWFLRAYAGRHERFAGWMVVRAAAASPDFPSPPNAKAWGGVIQRAAREGLIARCGTARDPHRHCNPIPLWAACAPP